MSQITNDGPGCNDNPELATPRTGEAAALVARLLSGCDQTNSAHAEAPAGSLPQAEAAPAPEVIPAEHPSALELAGNHEERSVPRSLDAGVLLPRSNRPRWLMVIVAAMVIFGAGVAVGYGVLGRGINGTQNATVVNGQAASPRNAANPETADDRTNGTNGTDDTTMSHGLDLAGPDAGLPSQDQNHVLPDATTNDKPQDAPARNIVSEHDPRTERPAARNGTSAVDRSGISPHSETGKETTLSQDVNMPASPPSTDSQALETSARGGGSDGKAVDSARTETATRLSKTPQIGNTSAPSEVVTGAAEAQVLPDRTLEQPTETTSASRNDIDPCELLHSVQPVYPLKARKLHVEGDVELRVVVGVDGTVRSVGLVSGPSLLVMAAIDAAREFRYRPALLDGKPIETVQTVEMAFKLKN